MHTRRNNLGQETGSLGVWKTKDQLNTCHFTGEKNRMYL
jgi:hypothetical protein